MKKINITKISYTDDEGEEHDLSELIKEGYIFEEPEAELAKEAAANSVMDKN